MMTPKTKNKWSNVLSQNRGAVAITVGLLLGVLVSMAALTVDIGYAYITRTELQAIADGAALAGTRQLGLVYEGLSQAEAENYTLSGGDQMVIQNMVQRVGQDNKAATVAIAINNGDIEIGQWDFTARTFTAGILNANAVRVTTRRDGTANGPIATFLAGVMGYNTMNISATATAALGALSTTDPGEIEAPVGISEMWFDQPDYCDQNIRFHPTGDLDGCAGWHTFDVNPTNAQRLGNMMIDMEAGNYESPASEAGYTDFSYTGGTVASIFDEFYELYDTKRMYDGDGDDAIWTTTIPVYGWDSCDNPRGMIQTTGFATVEIHTVIGPPTMEIVANVVCDKYASGRSQGSNFGTMGTIPGLVQ